MMRQLNLSDFKCLRVKQSCVRVLDIFIALWWGERGQGWSGEEGVFPVHINVGQSWSTFWRRQVTSCGLRTVMMKQDLTDKRDWWWERPTVVLKNYEWTKKRGPEAEGNRVSWDWQRAKERRLLVVCTGTCTKAWGNTFPSLGLKRPNMENQLESGW